jgi:N6-L-threonylcarbamoyladenine synthase
MIAWASMHRFLAGDVDEDALEVRPIWSIEDIHGLDTDGLVKT